MIITVLDKSKIKNLDFKQRHARTDKINDCKAILKHIQKSKTDVFTAKEFADKIYLSTQAISNYLRKMEAAGVIYVDAKRGRKDGWRNG